MVAVETPQTYGALRICLGTLALVNLATLWPHLDYLYGDFGVAPAQTCNEGLARLSLLCHVPARAFLAALMAAALAFTLGLCTRVSGILTVVLHASLWSRSMVSYAGEQVFADFLLLLCLARCGEAYSLDRWWRSGTVWTLVPSWPRYLMVLQLALCLGVNGWAKTGTTWRDGEALYYTLALDRYHTFPPWGLFAALGLDGIRWWTWAAWCIERGFPLVLLGLLIRPWLRGAPGWLRRLADWALGRRVWAPLAAGMMLGIMALMRIGWFAAATAVAVLCLFRGDELGRVFAALRRAPGPAQVVAEAPRPVWSMVAAGVFACWHGWTITTRALLP
ncbi:MAG: hypothetical protein JNK56_19940, partial [Myxococcales bacterium]|nr:hypothetical protein [Myxococcales bacterium]